MKLQEYANSCLDPTELMTSFISIQNQSTAIGGSQNLRNWKVGQVIKAVVISGTPPEQGGGRALLRISGRDYAVRSNLPLAAGDSVALKVTRLKPETVLQIAKPPAGASSNAPPIQSDAAKLESLASSIKSLLGKQTELLSGLQKLIAAKPSLSPGALQNLDKLLQSTPDLQTLGSAVSLRKALAQSGIHLEPMLLQGKTPAAGDLKLQLMNISQSLENQSSAGLRQTVDAMLARISLNQLHGTSLAQTQNGIHWMIEIPYQASGTFQTLRFEIDSRHESSESSTDMADDTWKVTLDMNSPSLGFIRTVISHSQGVTSARFWAESPETFARLHKAMPSLKQSWQARGLKPGALQAFQGNPPNDYKSNISADSSLLDAHV